MQRRSRRSEPPAISMSLGFSESFAAPAAPLFPGSLAEDGTHGRDAKPDRPRRNFRGDRCAIEFARSSTPRPVTLDLPATFRLAPPPMGTMEAMGPISKAPIRASREIALPLSFRELQPASVNVAATAAYTIAKPSMEIETMNPTRKAPAANSRQILSPVDAARASARAGDRERPRELPRQPHRQWLQKRGILRQSFLFRKIGSRCFRQKAVKHLRLRTSSSQRDIPRQRQTSEPASAPRSMRSPMKTKPGRNRSQALASGCGKGRLTLAACLQSTWAAGAALARKLAAL